MAYTCRSPTTTALYCIKACLETDLTTLDSWSEALTVKLPNQLGSAQPAPCPARVYNVGDVTIIMPTLTRMLSILVEVLTVFMTTIIGQYVHLLE